MCRQIDPELQKQFIREAAEEFRKWFRGWRRRVNGKRALAYSHLDQHRQTNSDALLSLIASRDCS